MKLSQKQIAEHMKRLEGWSLVDGKLVRELEFKDFADAMKFVNKVAKLAEKEEHHPDITIYSWNRVRLMLYTHDIGGLSDEDFNLAGKIEQI
ncbi:4a-hydroxytetrahydrobiopterin dehydratase [archaeon]|nr:MAG: 4a-hydroxytetrahydrobiopterin dehydratase [archaeon]